MGQARRLTRNISAQALAIAKVNAAKRWRKYLHASARRRLERQERAMVGESKT
jgi:predicted secreted protein